MRKHYASSSSASSFNWSLRELSLSSCLKSSFSRRPNCQWTHFRARDPSRVPKSSLWSAMQNLWSDSHSWPSKSRKHSFQESDFFYLYESFRKWVLTLDTLFQFITACKNVVFYRNCKLFCPLCKRHLFFRKIIEYVGSFLPSFHKRKVSHCWAKAKSS